MAEDGGPLYDYQSSIIKWITLFINRKLKVFVQYIQGQTQQIEISTYLFSLWNKNI